MAGCPNINFGIPESGATEFSFQSGREILRCGAGECVQLYITNVTLECSLVVHSCNAITGAIQGEVCMQSVQGQWRDQNIVNWIAKDGVNSSLADGSVITRAYCAGTGENSIFTHTEGSLSIRVLCNSSGLAGSAYSAKSAGLTKLTDTKLTDDMTWILSDVAVNVSPTTWQAGTITFQGFTKTMSTKKTYRGNFSYENGRIEEAHGELFYDDTSAPALMDSVITSMLGSYCTVV
jgi:hypothetical protein